MVIILDKGTHETEWTPAGVTVTSPGTQLHFKGPPGQGDITLKFLWGGYWQLVPTEAQLQASEDTGSSC